MRKLMIVFIVISFVYLNFYCARNKNECESKKVEILLEEVFKKSYLFPILPIVGETDSSFRYNYLYLKNITLPQNKKFYIHAQLFKGGTKIDTVKLIIINDLTKNLDANKVYISLDETDKDTNNIKIKVSYGLVGNVAQSEATFRYEYDSKNCKWIIKDSTFWQY